MGTTTRAQAAKSGVKLQALPDLPPIAAPSSLSSQLWSTVVSEGIARDAATVTRPASTLLIEGFHFTEDDATPPGCGLLPQTVDSMREDDGKAGIEDTSVAQVSAVPSHLGKRRRGRKSDHASGDIGVQVEDEQPESKYSSLRHSTQKERWEREIKKGDTVGRSDWSGMNNQLGKDTPTFEMGRLNLGLPSEKDFASNAVCEAKLKRRRRSRKRRRAKWNDAEKHLQTIRSRFSDPISLAAFERVLERTVQTLKAKDEENTKRIAQKATSRLFRALEIVKKPAAVSEYLSTKSIKQPRYNLRSNQHAPFTATVDRRQSGDTMIDWAEPTFMIQLPMRMKRESTQEDHGILARFQVLH